MPPEVLPIACSACGDIVCLVLEESEAGKAGAVVLWDNHAGFFHGEAPTYEFIYPVAESFVEFIDMICELPPEYLPTE